MISRKHRHLMVLVGLLLMFVVLVTFQMRTSEPPAAPAARASNRAATRATAPRRDAEVTDVKLDALQRAHDAAPESARNPFRFRPPPPPPPPRAAVPPPSAPVATAPPVPEGPPPPAPIPLKFFGLVGVQPPLAAFSDGRGTVFYGRDGDIIDGRYRILRIGPDSADLSYTDGRGRQTLRLSGQ